MLCGDMMVLATLFSKVLPQSTVHQLWLRMLWICCPPDQAHEHGKALMSNFGNLQKNRRRSWAQWCREKIRPDVVICLSEPLCGMASVWDGDLDVRTLDFYSHLGQAAGPCPCASVVCQLRFAPHRGPYRSPN